MAIPSLCWQNAETANALRQRAFELRFPSRLIEHEGADKPLADLLNLLRQAPSARAFVEALANTALPALGMLIANSSPARIRWRMLRLIDSWNFRFARRISK